MDDKMVAQVDVRRQTGKPVHMVFKVFPQLSYGLEVFSLQVSGLPTTMLQQQVFVVAQNRFAVRSLTEKMKDCLIARPFSDQIAYRDNPVLLAYADLSEKVYEFKVTAMDVTDHNGPRHYQGQLTPQNCYRQMKNS